MTKSTIVGWKLRVFTAGLNAALGGVLSLRGENNQSPTNASPSSQTVERIQAPAGRSSENSERLRKALKRFPPADANGDGVLTVEEARAFRQKAANAPSSPAKQKNATNGFAHANPPTFADVKYGPHERNALDFWKARSDRPTPVIVFIHGGGFQAGDKSMARKDPMLAEFLKSGISFASINYRFRKDAPIQEILHDAARAIQFIRYQATDWIVDKKRIAAYGGSAGAGTSLWLAAHDDLADLKNADPVLRESSRLTAAGLFATQATYDLLRWEEFLGPFKDEWLQSTNEIAEFYHFKTQADLRSRAGEHIRAECDMLRWLSKDDPPIYAFTSQRGGLSQSRGQYLHHPDHVSEIQKWCKAVGVECIVSLDNDNSTAGAGRNGFVKFVKRILRAGEAQ